MKYKAEISEIDVCPRSVIYLMCKSESQWLTQRPPQLKRQSCFIYHPGWGRKLYSEDKSHRKGWQVEWVTNARDGRVTILNSVRKPSQVQGTGHSWPLSVHCDSGQHPYKPTSLTRTKGFCWEPRAIFLEHSHRVVGFFFFILKKKIMFRGWLNLNN